MTINKAIVKLRNKQQIEIDILNNPVAQAVCELHQSNASKCPYWIRRATTSHHLQDPKNQKNGEGFVKDINDAIEAVEKLTGFRWPVKAYVGMDFDVCNLIHRFFTTSQLTGKIPTVGRNLRPDVFDIKLKQNPMEHEWQELLLSVSSEDVYQIKNDNDLLEFRNQIGKINAVLHSYEDSILSSQRALNMYNTITNEHKNGTITACTSVYDIAWSEKDRYGKRINVIDKPIIDSDWKDLRTDDPEVTVYALKCILGKDYLVGYTEYDDPRQWDMTSNNHICGGITLDPLASKHRFFQSDMFSSWLKDHNHPLDPKYYGSLPVGKISNIDNDLLWNMQRKDNAVKDWNSDYQMQSEQHSYDNEYTIEKIEFYQ